MDYVTPTVQDLNSLLFGGGGNTCPTGIGDYNNCSPCGDGTAGCSWIGGDGHTCSGPGMGNGDAPNTCPSGIG